MQQVFEPVPFAQRWERLGLDDIPPEDTPVGTRVHPGYRPPGVRAGSWMFNPTLTGGVIYNSNVLSSATDERGDAILRVEPRLHGYTLWDRHWMDVDAYVRSDTYRENSGLDQVDAGVRARGRLDIRHDMAVLASLRAAHLNEPVGSLSSPTGAVEPTPYILVTGDLTYWHNFNRLTAAIGGRIESYDFGSTRAQDGTTIDQSRRSGQIYAGHGRLEYVISPRLGVFTALEANRRDLRGTPTQSLSSEGYRALGGVNLGLTRLISGELGIGYAEQRFDAPTIEDIAGPTYRALLVWSPTRLVDVTLKAERTVTQAADTDATGIRVDRVQLGVDYELLRNVVISAAGTYERDRFFGQVREDTVHVALTQVKYLLNQHWSVSLRHRYTDRDSSQPLFTYDKHEVELNVSARF